MNQSSKFCKNCGCPLKEDDRFCKNCGTAVVNEQVTNNIEQQMNNPINNNVQNNVTYNQNPSTQNNSNQNFNMKYAIMAVVFLILIGVAVYFLLNMDKVNKLDNTSKNNNSVNNNSSSVSNKKPSSTRIVTYNGFTFKVPTDYKNEIDSNTLAISNGEGTWLAGIQILNGEFEKLLTSKDQVVNGIESRNYKINTYDSKTYSGMKCITMEAVSNGNKMIMAYVKATSSKIFVVSLYNEKNNYDYSIFENVTNVLKTGV